jgi:hypothetical protein
MYGLVATQRTGFKRSTSKSRGDRICGRLRQCAALRYLASGITLSIRSDLVLAASDITELIFQDKMTVYFSNLTR